MVENLDLVLQIIRVDLFIAFGLYTIVYLIISSFIKNEIINVIDETSNKIISFAGIVFLLIWISLLFKSYFESSEFEKSGMIQRMFGKYWFGYWLQPILWISLSQLLRLKKVRKQKILRIIFSIFFMVSIEQCIIILTSFERDYLPSSYSFNFTFIELIIGILTKICFFLVIVMLYFYLEKKLKSILNKT
ncbi:hypothetical protein SAMN05444377_11753 [Flavobacterium fontis]|uniref:DUF4328 domain-containing protein n=1 Tax=Flavobacterium fontis TaxID=1124188 RepID=A0A1M5E468_9FLAO|nr:hypothetical protein [Flavobacterium fontis]SHF73861.1 hypothetical protein SAMN05444377_11753 [Flavobacterium fontis]